MRVSSSIAHSLTMAPAIIVGNALLQGSVAASDEWRQYGEARRRELLENDKEARSFDMNHRKHGIKRYFQVGDRVLSQFRGLYERRRNLEEVYVMGNRLIAFYTEALPKHKDYRSIDPSISALREKSFADLDWIRKRLDVISLRIDEAELNAHIQRKQDIDDNDGACESPQVNGEANDNQETQWESFSGWATDLRGNEAVRWMETQQNTTSAPRPRSLLLEPEHANDPGDILDLESEDETDDAESSDGDSLSDTESDERAVHFEFASEEDNDYDSSFLRVIASEEVEYEEDSEAVDSWAQDDESLESIAEYAPRVATRTIDYSDAEMLGNLLNRMTQDSTLSEGTESRKAVSEANTDSSSDDEVENVDPAMSFSSVSKDTTATTLCSYPSFDEPPDEDDDITSSPQDVMNFDAHIGHHSRKESGASTVTFSDEEIVPIRI